MDRTRQDLNEMLDLIKKRIERIDEDDSRLLRDYLTSLMDELDDYDFFGTEGWKHRIGWE